MVRYFNSFAFKIQGLSIILILALSVAFIAIFYRHFRETNHANIESIAEMTVRYLNADIQAELQKSIDMTAFVAENVGRAGEEWDREFLVKMLAKDPAAFELYYGTALSRFDGGHFITATDWIPYSNPEWDQLKRPWFQFAMKNPGKLGITDPYIDDNTKKLCVTIVKTVHVPAGESKKDSIIGVVGLDVFLSDLTNMIGTRQVTEGGSTFLVNKEGLYITNTNDKHVLDRSIFQDLSAEFPKEKILSSKVSVIFGEADYVVSMPVENTDWFLVSTGPFADLDKSDIFAFLEVIIITIMLAFIISIFFSHLINKRIRYVMETLNSISNGNLSLKIDESHNDEISYMSKHFNMFIDKLRDFINFTSKYVLVLTDSSKVLNTINDKFSESMQKMSKIFKNVETMITHVNNIEDEVKQVEEKIKEASADSGNLKRAEEAIQAAAAKIKEISQNTNEIHGEADDMSKSLEFVKRVENDLRQNSEALQEASTDLAAMSQGLKTILRKFRL